jgi:hypothetical protein
MIKNWIKFNEGWFTKKEEESDLVPKGMMSSTGRPTEEDLNKSLSQPKIRVENKVDSELIQDISDRLYGPDSEEYINALRELNISFRARQGRYGSQLFDPSNLEQTKRREQEVISKINKK